MEWFIGCLGRAIAGARKTLHQVLEKARFWEQIKSVPLNERQRRVLNRLWNGFEGKLTTSTLDTAHSVLTQNPEGGRSTSYALAPVR